MSDSSNSLSGSFDSSDDSDYPQKKRLSSSKKRRTSAGAHNSHHTHSNVTTGRSRNASNSRSHSASGGSSSQWGFAGKGGSRARTPTACILCGGCVFFLILFLIFGIIYWFFWRVASPPLNTATINYVVPTVIPVTSSAPVTTTANSLVIGAAYNPGDALLDYERQHLTFLVTKLIKHYQHPETIPSSINSMTKFCLEKASKDIFADMTQSIVEMIRVDSCLAVTKNDILQKSPTWFSHSARGGTVIENLVCTNCEVTP